ncbi:MAG: PHA/PHB synthase family protein [Gammaproteobacteria bacterium]
MMKNEDQCHPKHVSEKLDHTLQATLGQITGGISPAAFILAFVDWYSHLLIHPAKQVELMELYTKNSLHIFDQFTKHLRGDSSGEFAALSTSTDKRFVDKAWQQFPFSFTYESFLLVQNWWDTATKDVRGVNDHNENVVNFSVRQFLDMLSPSNSPFLNPEVLQKTMGSGGSNFVTGYENFIDDMRRQKENLPPAGSENFVIGENLACTPGKVVYRNRLIELIQYAPTTEKVYAEPILITPAWIMKYYILDLSHKHSLVRYLVRKGHTVFMISWKNPDKDDRDLGMEDYVDLGVLSALDVINAIIPKQKVHLVGYCLGGTLSAITAATLARENDKRLASMTLLAAQTDFTEPGELGLFIDESQIAFLENLMQESGYLDTHQMAGAFQMLRSNDLIWSRIIREYMLGERGTLNDLMAWNADATRMPYKMHSQYLRNLFLNNQLAEGKYIMHGKPIAMADVHLPTFVVSTEKDHVSPWHSVFKINLLTPGDVTFALTSGGHNAGIVSKPSKKTKRYYHISTIKKEDRYIDADTWYKNTPARQGSWWPAFEKWIAKHSAEQKISPPPMGAAKAGFGVLGDAPGTYVLQK